MASKNKISYTNKDAASLFADLVAAIPLMTDKWKNYAEDDPGIVLLKLASFVGDMLCYNMDFQVNETFPQTALQRKNAQKSYDLIGYKMHWYRSAECTIRVTFNRPNTIPSAQTITVVVPEFTELLTPDKIPYVLIGNVENRTIVLSSTQMTVSKDFIAVQGSSMRQLNITSDRIINNGRIYVSNNAVDEDEQNDSNYAHMRLQTYDSATDLPLDDGLWTKVSNLLDIKEEGRYYELRVDDNNQPYIQLCDNYLDYVSQTNNYLGLSFIISNGVKGAVAENIGFTFNSAVSFSYNGSLYDLADHVIVTNTQSSQGKNPETVAQASKTAAKEARTLGVAITLSDYEILCKTADGIRACLAVDYSTDIGVDIASQDILAAATVTDNLLTAAVPDLLGYSIDPESVVISLSANTGAITADIHDNGIGGLVQVAGETETRLGVSHINYDSGVFEIDLSSLATITVLDSIVISFKKLYAPYSVILKLVANDYGYIPDYSKTILDEILLNKTIATVKYAFENAKIKSVPFNIGIYSYEPWSATDPSLTNYVNAVVNKTLFDYFNSTERIFGETLSYPNLCLQIQDSDSKIKLADLYYPTRNYKVLKDEYPRLGPVCINLSDNTNFAWLLENLFDETTTANTNYNTMATSIFGADGGGTIDFHTVLNSNTSMTSIESALTLASSVIVAGKTLPVSWWCSRPDLVVVNTSNQTIWGNLTSAAITQDTPITLFAIVHYNDSSLVLAEQPVNLVLKKYEEA